MAQQQALFGGNVTGRRLCGVKINPIYQGNIPRVQGDRAVDTHSESALPVGEIQIEVYDTFPRNVPKPFRQCKSSPAFPSSPRHSLDGSESDELPGKVELGASSAAQRGDCEKDSEWDGINGTVKTVDDNHECTLRTLRGRAEDSRGEIHSGRQDDLGSAMNHTLTVYNQLPSSVEVKFPSTVFHIPSTEEIQVITDEDIYENSNVCDMTEMDKSFEIYPVMQNEYGEGENLYDFTHIERSTHDCQSYFVSMDYNEHVARYISQSPSSYDRTEASVDKNLYSDINVCENIAQSGMSDNPDMKTVDVIDRSTIGSVKSDNLTQHNDNISSKSLAADSHVICKCPCHYLSYVSDLCESSTSGTGRHLTHLHEKSGNSDTEGRNQNTPSEVVPTKLTGSHASSELKPNGNEMHAHSDLETGDETFNRPHRQNNDECSVDFEHNIDHCAAHSHYEQHPNPPPSDNGSIEADLSYNDRNEDESELYSTNNDTDKHIESTQNDSSCSLINSISHNSHSNNIMCSEESVLTDFNTQETHSCPMIVCQLCGCVLNVSGLQVSLPQSTTGLVRTEMTSEDRSDDDDGRDDRTESLITSQTASNGVISFLPGDPVLLRADELSAPTSVQRYLAKAHEHYLRQYNDQFLYCDPVTADSIISALPSDIVSALPSSPDDAPTLYPDVIGQVGNDVAPLDTSVESVHRDVNCNDSRVGHLQPNVNLSGDSVSYVEELGSPGTKTSCWRKPFKSNGGSAASRTNSRQSSLTNSRHSSRNSRGAKHSSIEDMDAQYDEEAMAGSQWGGSSNRSNSIVDRNDNLKKAGLSVVQVSGTSTDPGFEMIVPSDEAYEMESNYSSRRRQRLEEMAEQSARKGEEIPLRERIIKTAVFTLVFCAIVGIFVGVAVHFGKDSGEEDDVSVNTGNAVHVGAGSVYG